MLDQIPDGLLAEMKQYPAIHDTVMKNPWALEGLCELYQKRHPVFTHGLQSAAIANEAMNVFPQTRRIGTAVILSATQHDEGKVIISEDDLRGGKDRRNNVKPHHKETLDRLRNRRSVMPQNASMINAVLAITGPLHEVHVPEDEAYPRQKQRQNKENGPFFPRTKYPKPIRRAWDIVACSERVNAMLARNDPYRDYQRVNGRKPLTPSEVFQILIDQGFEKKLVSACIQAQLALHD